MHKNTHQKNLYYIFCSLIFLFSTVINKPAYSLSSEQASELLQLRQNHQAQQQLIEQQQIEIDQLKSQIMSLKNLIEQYKEQSYGVIDDASTIPLPSSEKSNEQPISKTETAAYKEDKKSIDNLFQTLQKLDRNIWYLLGGMFLIILSLPSYFLLYLPFRRNRRLQNALRIVERQRIEDYQQAEELLQATLVDGLRKKEITEAKFALAYVRARLGKLAEASAILSELKDVVKLDHNIIYLNLWLQCRLKNHDKVENIYLENSQTLDEFLDSKRIFGITLLYRAQQHWRQRQVDSALHYFNELRKLDVFIDKIPNYIDQQLIILGLLALFDKNLDEARKHFQGALDKANSDNRSMVPGKLGLLLCTWISSEIPEIDDELYHTILEIPGAKEIIENKEIDTDVQSDKSTKEKEPELLKNVLLWYAISLLFLWLRLPANQGLPAEELLKLKQRLGYVRKVDANMGDPYLLEALITYFFSSNDTERATAIKILQQAVDNDIHIPEALDLIQRENRLVKQRQNSLQLFMELLRRYLSDASVPESLREELRGHLASYSAYEKVGDIDLTKGGEETAPSVEELRQRSALIHRRIQTIVKPKLSSEKVNSKDQEQIFGLMQNLDSASKNLSENVNKLQQAEFGVLEATGEFLFEEEELTVNNLETDKIDAESDTASTA